MKNRIVLLLLAVLILSSFLAGCGKTYTFDDISTMTSSNQEYTINSIDGETFILHGGRRSQNVENAGTVYYSSEKTTYEYSLEGDNVIIVDGTRYTYTIDVDGKPVRFSPAFLGCASTFDIRVNFK